MKSSDVGCHSSKLSCRLSIKRNMMNPQIDIQKQKILVVCHSSAIWFCAWSISYQNDLSLNVVQRNLRHVYVTIENAMLLF